MIKFQITILTLVIMLLFGGLLAGCGGKDERIRQFAGHYEGTYLGDASGRWSAEITFNGIVEATIIDSTGGEIFGRGSISPTGEFSLDTKGRVMDRIGFATWRGNFKVMNGGVYGSGQWSAGDSFRGTWEGRKISDLQRGQTP